MKPPKPADWERWCDHAGLSWKYLGDVGDEMIRLAKMPTTEPDGFGVGGTSERVDGEGDFSTVERAALADQLDDLVGRWLDEGFRLTREAQRLALRAEVLFRMVEARGDERKGRQVTGGDCICCGRYVPGSSEDRLRSGYCEACYSAWRRWKDGRSDPSPVVFRRWRLAELRPPA